MEGQNLTFEYRSADGGNERFTALAGELVRLGVDVIVTRGTPAALAARAASTTVPVVMAAAGDPLAIARSPERPALNMTGFGAAARGIEAKRVALLKELIPNVARVAALMNLSNPSRQAEWTEIAAGARALGVEAEVLDTRTVADIERSFDAAVRLRADALAVGSDTVMQSNQDLVIALAAARRLPAIYTFRDYVEAGGLASYGVSLPALYRQAAGYVDRILQGAKPDSLPIEPPAKFELVINLSTATTLGISVPSKLMPHVDEFIR